MKTNINKTFLDIQSTKINETIAEFENFLRTYDQMLFKTRDKKYRVKEIRTKTLQLPLMDLKNGIFLKTIKFRRRIYINDQNKCVYLTDKKLNIKSKRPLISLNSIEIMEGILNSYSYKKLIKTKGYSFSSTQISKLLCKIKLYIQITKFKGQHEELFISADGMYLNSRRPKLKHMRSAKKEFKSLVIFSGVKNANKTSKSHKQRQKLINRLIIPFPRNIKTKEMAAVAEKIIKQSYNGVKRINLVGDGATWISNLRDYFTIPCTRYIDSFHFIKWVREFLPLRRREKLNHYDFLNLKTQKDFLNYLVSINPKPFTDKYGEVSHKKASENKDVKELLRWFPSWKAGVNSGVKSCIEGIQGNYFAEIFKRKRKFNESNFEKLMFYHCASLNNWIIKDKYFKDSVFWKNLYNINIKKEISAYEPISQTEPHGIKTKGFVDIMR